jgi:hypothetical protein
LWSPYDDNPALQTFSTNNNSTWLHMQLSQVLFKLEPTLTSGYINIIMTATTNTTISTNDNDNNNKKQQQQH